MGTRDCRRLETEETAEDRLLLAGLRSLDVQDKTSRAPGPVITATGEANGEISCTRTLFSHFHGIDAALPGAFIAVLWHCHGTDACHT